MRLADMHIHTTFSPDGKSSMEEQCIKASSTPMCAARPTQTRKRAAWSLTLRKAASLSV